VPVRSGSFAAIATSTSSTRRLGSRSALSPGPAPVRPQSPGWPPPRRRPLRARPPGRGGV